MKELKALEILKRFSNEDAYYYDESFAISWEEISEAIAELEAIQAPKTCDTNCFYYAKYQKDNCSNIYPCIRKDSQIIDRFKPKS